MKRKQMRCKCVTKDQISKLEDMTGFNKSKIIRLLNSLIAKKYIRKLGQSKSTYYSKYDII